MNPFPTSDSVEDAHLSDSYRGMLSASIRRVVVISIHTSDRFRWNEKSGRSPPHPSQAELSALFRVVRRADTCSYSRPHWFTTQNPALICNVVTFKPCIRQGAFPRRQSTNAAALRTAVALAEASASIGRLLEFSGQWLAELRQMHFQHRTLIAYVEVLACTEFFIECTAGQIALFFKPSSQCGHEAFPLRSLRN